MTTIEPNRTLYRVVRDYQGGTFGMGRAQNATEWLEDMVGWRDADDSWEDEKDRQKAIDQAKYDIANGREQDLIDYIAEIWDLDLEPIPQDLIDKYHTYVEEYHQNGYGEPVCLCEWLDNEVSEND